MIRFMRKDGVDIYINPDHVSWIVQCKSSKPDSPITIILTQSENEEIEVRGDVHEIAKELSKGIRC